MRASRRVALAQRVAMSRTSRRDFFGTAACAVQLRIDRPRIDGDWQLLKAIVSKAAARSFPRR